MGVVAGESWNVFMLPVSFENEGWQASCRPHLVISADSMTRKRHENAMSIVMKGEAFHERLSRTTAGWGQAHRAGTSPQGGGKPRPYYTRAWQAGSSVEKGRAWRSP